ncbi:unnamed protein product [Prunus brigantina]
MSRRSLRSGAAELVRSRWHSQESTSRSRWEMEDASSVCSRLCYCGNISKTHTSWTVSHPGRRFQVCARVSLFLSKFDLTFGIFVDSNCDAAHLCFKTLFPFMQTNGCTFWEWADPEMCDRSKHIIPGLLRKINLLEQERNAGKGKMKNPWFWASIFMFGMVIYLLFSKCNRRFAHLQLAG